MWRQNDNNHNDDNSMKIFDHAQQGLLNLYHAKLRSLLALLGVLVGTASVVAMVLGGELATNEALKQFKSLGTDLLAVSVNNIYDEANPSAKSQELTLTDALALGAADPQIVRVAPYTQIFYPMFYHGESLNGMILGVTDSFADIVHVQLQAGRFVSMMDNYAFYCVVGRDLYDAMKRISAEEPLGQPLQVGKHMFVIVGVADAWPENSFVYANVNNSVLVPLLASTAISKYAHINNIIMRLTNGADIFSVEDHIHHVVESSFSGKHVSIRSAKELIAKMRKQSDILTVFLGLIGSVSLLVGGIGVMNIMLVSVIERRREIGIRKAVGATRFDISILFLIESVILSLLGGTLGVMMGIVIAYIIAWIWHWQFTLFLWPPVVGFSVSVAIGIFFGFYPAYKAACLDPITALRAD